MENAGKEAGSRKIYPSTVLLRRKTIATAMPLDQEQEVQEHVNGHAIPEQSPEASSAKRRRVSRSVLPTRVSSACERCRHHKSRVGTSQIRGFGWYAEVEGDIVRSVPALFVVCPRECGLSTDCDAGAKG